MVKKPARGNHERDKLKESRGASDPWAYLDSLPDQAFKAAGVAQGFKLAHPVPDSGTGSQLDTAPELSLGDRQERERAQRTLRL